MLCAYGVFLCVLYNCEYALCAFRCLLYVYCVCESALCAFRCLCMCIVLLEVCAVHIRCLLYVYCACVSMHCARFRVCCMSIVHVYVCAVHVLAYVRIPVCVCVRGSTIDAGGATAGGGRACYLDRPSLNRRERNCTHIRISHFFQTSL